MPTAFLLSINSYEGGRVKFLKLRVVFNTPFLNIVRRNSMNAYSNLSVTCGAGLGVEAYYRCGDLLKGWRLIKGGLLSWGLFRGGLLKGD